LSIRYSVHFIFYPQKGAELKALIFADKGLYMAINQRHLRLSIGVNRRVIVKETYLTIYS